MARIPPDDAVTVVLRFLTTSYPADDAAERRIRLAQTLNRLARKGRSRDAMERAVTLGALKGLTHREQQMTRRQATQLNAQVERARRDVDRALASLRSLWPAYDENPLDDDTLFDVRNLLINQALASLARMKRPRPGRPWDAQRVTDAALRECGVGAHDRRELLDILFGK